MPCFLTVGEQRFVYNSNIRRQVDRNKFYWLLCQKNYVIVLFVRLFVVLSLYM